MSLNSNLTRKRTEKELSFHPDMSWQLTITFDGVTGEAGRQLVVWTLECSGPLSAQQTEWCDDLSLDTRRRRGERSHQWKLVPLLILRNYAQWDPSWAPGTHVYTTVDRGRFCHGCSSLNVSESENRLSYWVLEQSQPDEGLGNFLSPGPRLSTIRVFPQRIWLDNWRRT